MIFQLLAAFVAAVLVLHRHRPDAPRDTTDHRVLRVHAVAEKEAQVGREVVDVHAARQIAFDIGEAVRERERQLADRVRPGLGNVVARDRHRVEIAHLMFDEILLNVAHHFQRELGAEDAGVLTLVLLENVGLHRAAHRRQGKCPDLGVFFGTGVALVLGLELRDLLVDRGVHEHGQQHRRRPVDGHRNRGARGTEVEAVVQHPHVFKRADGHAGIADLAVNVGALGRIPAIERDRVKGRRQAVCGHALRQALEAAVGAECVAFTGEHARGVFTFALERKHARRKRKIAGQIFLHQETQQLTLIPEAGQGDLAHLGARQRFGGEHGGQFLVAHPGHMGVAAVLLDHFGPLRQQLARCRQQVTLLGLQHRLDGRRGVRVCTGQQAVADAQRLTLAGHLHLGLHILVVAADRLGNFGQIAHAVGRDHGQSGGGTAHAHRFEPRLFSLEALRFQRREDGLIQRRHAVVVEARRHGAEHRHHVGRLAKALAVALVLLAHVAQGVFGPLAIELVEGDEIGEVDHVDLLKL